MLAGLVSATLTLCCIVSPTLAQDDTAPDDAPVTNLLQQFQKDSTAPDAGPTIPAGPPAAPLVGKDNTPADITNIVPAPISPDTAAPVGIAPVLGPDGLPLITPQPATYEDQPTARLRALDKVTGRTSTFNIPVGQEFIFGKLTIAVRTCKKRPPIEPPESAVFLQIVEKQQAKSKDFTPIFSGWMFASSPSLSALEHPVYDVWLVECVGK